MVEGSRLKVEGWQVEGKKSEECNSKPGTYRLKESGPKGSR